jgi:hypothetical protein
MKITSAQDTLPAKVSFKIDKAIKIFQDKQKLKWCMTHKATTTEDSTRNSAHRILKQTKPQEEASNHRRSKEK